MRASVQVDKALLVHSREKLTEMIEEQRRKVKRELLADLRNSLAMRRTDYQAWPTKETATRSNPFTFKTAEAGNAGSGETGGSHGQ